MSKLLYQSDAYLKSFAATVRHADPSAGGVVLDRSAFFPGGGGQPCDEGVLEWEGKHFEVEKLERRDGQLWHLGSGDVPAVGVTVEGRIDWVRRYALMRTHTALHILCGVIWRDYRAQVTGGNMQPLSGRLDFEFERLDQELVREIEAKINAEVDAARPVSTRILPRADAEKIPDLIRTKINLLPASLTEIRTVEIRGLDLQADGGTHVANTAEVGPITIADYKSKGRLNKRIHVTLQAADTPVNHDPTPGIKARLRTSFESESRSDE